MNIIAFILNIPWSLIGIILSLISIPKTINFSKNPFAFVFNVKSFWWYNWLPKKKGIRAMVIGNVVLLGPHILKNDLEHELVHVRQSAKEPIIHPFLYTIESWKKGYRNNKYEVEAYETTNSSYTHSK